jgi:hypothetical protein
MSMTKIYLCLVYVLSYPHSSTVKTKFILVSACSSTHYIIFQALVLVSPTRLLRHSSRASYTDVGMSNIYCKKLSVRLSKNACTSSCGVLWCDSPQMEGSLIIEYIESPLRLETCFSIPQRWRVEPEMPAPVTTHMLAYILSATSNVPMFASKFLRKSTMTTMVQSSTANHGIHGFVASRWW